MSARGWIGVIAAAALPLGLLVAAPASASDGAAPVAAAGEPADVVGLIVLKARPEVGARSLAATAFHAGADVDPQPADPTRLAVIDFAEPITAAEAAPIAAALEARADVIAVEPNRRIHPTASPVIPNDPLFSAQWDMWDGGGSSDFGTRAAQMWGVTRGLASTVVGVIDTGSTVHPDLAGTTVPGFDFISDAAVARDGNRWDSNPSDEGDWCGAKPSSWHGTHVAGTINAIQDNSIGVTGLAPEVKVQHLRVLGECGGDGADALAAALWGAGLDVSAWFPIAGANPGINPTPVSVLNLSLGGEGTCDAVSQEIFSAVRARGVTVVIAAGNETASVSTSWPANCAGVVSVGSSTRGGGLASTSNYGTAPGQLTISAPGGSIMSTYNTGREAPATPDYQRISGTSMATPHVAAAAAVLYGFGVTSPTAVISALTSSVRAFPAGSGCDVIRCGAGLLDASKLTAYAPTGDPGVPTDITVAPRDSAALVSWKAPTVTGGSEIVSATAVASPGGQACTTATTSCEITGLANGSEYTVSVAVTNAAGRTGLPGVSAPFTPSVITRPSKVLDFSNGRFAGDSPRLRVTVRWEPPRRDGGSPIIGYRVRYGLNGTFTSWRTVDTTSVRLKKLRAGKEYIVQVRALNELGGGPRAGYELRTPRR